jgi:hypothetical protein
MGLTGPIKGEIGRVRQLSLGKYSLTNVLSSFPDSRGDNSFSAERDGNLGMDALKRFMLIFDYSKGMLYLKSRGNLKEPFERDMSGLEYYAGGDELKRVVISRVEPGSAGDDVGLITDDEITSVNFKPVVNMKPGRARPPFPIWRRQEFTAGDLPRKEIQQGDINLKKKDIATLNCKAKPVFIIEKHKFFSRNLAAFRQSVLPNILRLE